MKIVSVVSCICLFVFSGCIQKIAIGSIGGIMDNGFEVLNEEQDLDIADKAIASDLKLLEAVMKSDPENEHFLLLASMGYSSYALGFVEDDSAPRASIFYQRGRDYGLKILRKNQHFAEAENKDLVEFQKSINTFSKDDVPAIFWTAIGWGNYVYLNLTDPSLVADLPKIESMMQFVLQTDSNYFYGGAHFFLGTLYGTRPRMFGGDSTLSRQHFESCIAINGGKFLMTYVYYARSMAVQYQDKELFEQCLTKVDTTSLDVLPAARLSNAIAKKKAKLLRAKINDLF
ncbi:MAG: TRAP transporter TatT component family protein [Bacteroidota bacterium]